MKNAEASRQSHVKTVEVAATSGIGDGGPAIARQAAIDKSLSMAVDQVVSSEIPPEILARQAGAVKAALAGKTQQCIDHYKVIQAEDAEDRYRVVVAVAVSVTQIKEELERAGILLGGAVMPKVLFLTSQQAVGEVIPQFWWSGTAQGAELVAELAMMEALRKKGFSIISSRDPSARTIAASKRFSPHLENQEAADLASRIGADVVVVGKTVAEAIPSPTGEAVRPFRATATIRALRVSSAGDLVAVTKGVVVEAGDDLTGGRQALAAAGEAAGKALADRLIPAWKAREAADSFIRVDVEGTRALARFVRFRKILEQTPGVNQVRIRVLKPDNAVLAVDFDGNSDGLARSMRANAYPSFSINITDVGREGVKLRLVGGAGTTAAYQ